MTYRLACAAGALLLLAGAAMAASDDAMTGRINHGGAEAAKGPPVLPEGGGSGPNAIDDPLRDDGATVTRGAANEASGDAGLRDGTLGRAPAGAPPGAS